MANRRRGDGKGRAPVTVAVTIEPGPRTPAWSDLWRRLLDPSPAEVAQQEAEAAAQPARERSADHGEA